MKYEKSIKDIFAEELDKVWGELKRNFIEAQKKKGMAH